MTMQIELYEFARDGEVWRYTPHEFDVGLAGETWQSIALSRNQLQLGSEPVKAALELSVPPDLPLLAHLLHLSGANAVMTVTLRGAQMHEAMWVWDDGVRWMGRVLGAEVSETGARIRCESVAVSMKRIGLRRLYSRKCSHVLYSVACGAGQVSASAEVAGVNGRAVSFVGGPPPMVSNALTGGWLETPNGVRYMITEEAWGGVTLLSPAALNLGDMVTLVAGCDHTTTTCQGRFNNLDNFGGFPGIPQKNPFATGVF